MNKTWGLEWEEEWRGEKCARVFIKSQFYHNDKFQCGLNEKFLKQCQDQGIVKIIINVDGTDRQTIETPTEKFLKNMTKDKQFQEIPSKFENSPPMKIYLFYL